MKGANAFPLRVITLFSHYYAVFSSTHFGSNFFVSLETLGDVPLHGASVYNVISEDPCMTLTPIAERLFRITCIMHFFPLRILVLMFGFFSFLNSLIWRRHHYMGHPFIMSSPRTHDTHTYCWALGSGAVTTCFYDLYWSVAAGFRTPNLACGANALTHCANAAYLVLIGLIMINLSA